MLLTVETSIMQTTVAYDVYTLVFGLLVLVFAVFIWQGKKAGWIGTVAVSLFVIVADTLTVLNLPSIPGIPKFAALTEIAYSLLVIIYLLQNDIRRKYLAYFGKAWQQIMRNHSLSKNHSFLRVDAAVAFSILEWAAKVFLKFSLEYFIQVHVGTSQAACI